MTDRQTAANATTDTEDMISTNLGRTLVGPPQTFYLIMTLYALWLSRQSTVYVVAHLLWHMGDIEPGTLLMVQRRLSLPAWTILVNTWSICQGCHLLSVALSVAILFSRYYTSFPLAACLSHSISRISSTQSSTSSS